jgi:hypothetical protein
MEIFLFLLTSITDPLNFEEEKNKKTTTTEDEGETSRILYVRYLSVCSLVLIGSPCPLTRKRVLPPPFGSGGATLTSG